MTEKQIRKLIKKEISKKLRGYTEDQLVEIYSGSSWNSVDPNNPLLTFMKEDEIIKMEILNNLSTRLNGY